MRHWYLGNYVSHAIVVAGRSGTPEHPVLWTRGDHGLHYIVQNTPCHYPTVFLGVPIDPVAIFYDH